MKRFTVLNVILLVLIGLAGWRTAEVWRRQAPKIDASSDSFRPGPSLPPVPRKPSMPTLVNQIAKQDLFDISRSEANAEGVPTPEATPPPPPTLRLAGVIFAGLAPEAVLMDSSQKGKQIRLRVGEEIAGYRVQRILTGSCRAMAAASR